MVPASQSVDLVTVGTREAGQRLDNFLLSRLRGVPRSHVYRIVRRGEVRINAGRAGPDYRLRAGDVVRIPPVRTAKRPQAPLPAAAHGLAGRVLFEDEHLLAVDKPAGLAVHAGTGIEVGAIEMLRRTRPQNPYLELVHRLDRETSGCLLLAKSRRALTALHAMLRPHAQHRVDKRYVALVRGRWSEGERVVEAALARDRLWAGERVVAVAPHGRESQSRFRPLEAFATCALVEIRLLTGRTHQARAHAAHIGHPIAGDRKYGDRDFDRSLRELGLRRLFLHAASLQFRHPLTGAPTRIEAPMPQELERVLTRLRSP